jgi:AcrR family transcriptional regulator
MATVVRVSVRTEHGVAADRPDPSGLRERKKDATRRALAETAMNLAIDRGYATVTIADITDAVGVSRRTFSNYFSGKAECVAAVTEGWFDDIAQSIRDAPDGQPLDQLLCNALLRVAADLPQRWERFFSLLHDEPELKAMVGAIDEASCEQLVQVVAPRLGLDVDDIRVRMLSSFGILAGRTCLEDWVLRGRPAGSESFAAQLELALSIIDLHAFDPPNVAPNDPPNAPDDPPKPPTVAPNVAKSDPPDPLPDDPGPTAVPDVIS